MKTDPVVRIVRRTWRRDLSKNYMTLTAALSALERLRPGSNRVQLSYCLRTGQSVCTTHATYELLWPPLVELDPDPDAPPAPPRGRGRPPNRKPAQPVEIPMAVLRGQGFSAASQASAS